MSESNDTRSLNQCYKCDQQLMDILSIEYDSSNSTIVMWNKYQIFIYEDFNFTSPAKVFTPEYQVHRLLLTNNYLLSLDINGFVHVTTLKFKNSDQKLYKCSYQPREQGMKACIVYNSHESLNLKYDSETYYLCLNKINNDFKEVKKVALNTKDYWPVQDNSKDKYILAYHEMDKCYSLILKGMCCIEKLHCGSQCRLIVMSFDKRTVYGCLFNRRMMDNKVDLFKLYSCPSEISNIEIIGYETIYMFIELKMGAVLRLGINNLDIGNTTNISPEVTYLNSALHKVKSININGMLVYTDGATMWKVENIFSMNTTFEQFFVKNVNDFIICGDKIICTTFTKLIYSFKLQAEESYLKPVKKNYYAADELLQNSEFLHKIFEEVDKGKELAKQLSIEGSYIAAMALSRRQEIMHKIISCSVKVFGSFEEVMRGNNEKLTLMEDISKYVQPDIYLICVSTQINDAHRAIFDILSNIMANSETELQVTLSNKHKIIQTTSLKMNNTNILIPLQLDDATEIYVNIRLVARVPGTYDKKQKIWTELYKNNIILTLDHFIRVNSPKSLIYLEGVTDNFEEAIQICSNQDRQEFEFSNTSKHTNTHIMYVGLPPEFKSFDKHFDNCKSKFIREMLSIDEFLKSKIDVTFTIGKETVAVGLENDGFSNPRLKVTSGNMRVTASMRNSFADMVYGARACEPGQEFINIGFYTTVENLQNAVKTCVTASASYEELAPLMEKFEKDVVAMLPV